MIRVLHVFHEMANGGVEAFVMNNYRKMDRSKVQFDFLTTVDRPGYYDDEIRKLGGHIYRTYPLMKNPLKCYDDIVRIVRENRYQYVHRHTGSAFGYFELRAARKAGAEHLIIHSHNPKARTPILHKLSQILMQFDCEQLACSEDAGKHLFGNSSFKIVPNAIECERYAFSKDIRIQMREELGIDEETFVVGHVGRFETQKNHRKLLEIFSEFQSQRPNSVLVCVGTGTLMNQTAEYAQELGISNKVKFLGTRNDVNRILQVFDVFCLPSLYEGFSITQVEAQTNGLMCFVAEDNIPKDSDLTGNVRFIPLNAENEIWAKEMLNSVTVRDVNAVEKIRNKGYDISKTAAELQKYYLSL